MQAVAQHVARGVLQYVQRCLAQYMSVRVRMPFSTSLQSVYTFTYQVYVSACENAFFTKHFKAYIHLHTYTSIYECV